MLSQGSLFHFNPAKGLQKGIRVGRIKRSHRILYQLSVNSFKALGPP